MTVADSDFPRCTWPQAARVLDALDAAQRSVMKARRLQVGAGVMWELSRLRRERSIAFRHFG